MFLEFGIDWIARSIQQARPFSFHASLCILPMHPGNIISQSESFRQFKPADWEKPRNAGGCACVARNVIYRVPTLFPEINVNKRGFK